MDDRNRHAGSGLIVGFLVGWFWHKNSSDQVSVVDDSETSASTTDVTGNVSGSSTVPMLETTYQTIDAPASVSVDDQKAGSLVFVKHTDASKPTWIAVREIVNGSIGNILGAGMVTSTTDDVPVSLLRPTKAGSQYAIFLYQDNGDGTFDSRKDMLIEQGGSPVSAMFTAQ